MVRAKRPSREGEREMDSGFSYPPALGRREQMRRSLHAPAEARQRWRRRRGGEEDEPAAAPARSGEAEGEQEPEHEQEQEEEEELPPTPARRRDRESQAASKGERGRRGRGSEHEKEKKLQRRHQGRAVRLHKGVEREKRKRRKVARKRPREADRERSSRKRRAKARGARIALAGAEKEEENEENEGLAATTPPALSMDALAQSAAFVRIATLSPTTRVHDASTDEEGAGAAVGAKNEEEDENRFRVQGKVSLRWNHRACMGNLDDDDDDEEDGDDGIRERGGHTSTAVYNEDGPLRMHAQTVFNVVITEQHGSHAFVPSSSSSSASSSASVPPPPIRGRHTRVSVFFYDEWANKMLFVDKDDVLDLCGPRTLITEDPQAQDPLDHPYCIVVARDDLLRRLPSARGVAAHGVAATASIAVQVSLPAEQSEVILTSKNLADVAIPRRLARPGARPARGPGRTGRVLAGAALLASAPTGVARRRGARNAGQIAQLPESYLYTKLGDIMPDAGTAQTHVYGVLVGFGFPRPSGGSHAFFCTYNLIDATLPGVPTEHIALNVFSSSLDGFPTAIAIGDILRCHRLKPQVYSGKPQLVGWPNKKASFVTVRRSTPQDGMASAQVLTTASSASSSPSASSSTAATTATTTTPATASGSTAQPNVNLHPADSGTGDDEAIEGKHRELVPFHSSAANVFWQMQRAASRGARADASSQQTQPPPPPPPQQQQQQKPKPPAPQPHGVDQNGAAAQAPNGSHTPSTGGAKRGYGAAKALLGSGWDVLANTNSFTFTDSDRDTCVALADWAERFFRANSIHGPGPPAAGAAQTQGNGPTSARGAASQRPPTDASGVTMRTLAEARERVQLSKNSEVCDMVVMVVGVIPADGSNAAPEGRPQPHSPDAVPDDTERQDGSGSAGAPTDSRRKRFERQDPGILGNGQTVEGWIEIWDGSGPGFLPLARSVGGTAARTATDKAKAHTVWTSIADAARSSGSSELLAALAPHAHTHGGGHRGVPMPPALCGSVLTIPMSYHWESVTRMGLKAGDWVNIRNLHMLHVAGAVQQHQAWDRVGVALDSAFNVLPPYAQDVRTVLSRVAEWQRQMQGLPVQVPAPPRSTHTDLGIPYTCLAGVVASQAPQKFAALVRVTGFWPESVDDFAQPCTDNASINSTDGDGGDGASGGADADADADNASDGAEAGQGYEYLFSLRVADDTAENVHIVAAGADATFLLNGVDANHFARDNQFRLRVAQRLQEVIADGRTLCCYIKSFTAPGTEPAATARPPKGSAALKRFRIFGTSVF